jgi:hypothetical protein
MYVKVSKHAAMARSLAIQVIRMLVGLNRMKVARARRLSFSHMLKRFKKAVNHCDVVYTLQFFNTHEMGKIYLDSS